MICTRSHRHTAGIVAAALALGIAAPAASARPFDLDSSGSFAPANFPPAPAHTASVTSKHASGTSNVEYLAIGAGGAAVVLISLGGTREATRRRHHPTTNRQSTTAA